MTRADTLDRSALPANPVDAYRIAALVMGGVLILATAPARAVDGCQVLLCLASGNWRGISQCVPPVQQVLRDMARGKPFPRCDMSGPGNSAEHQWSNPPAFCPPQYTHVQEFGDGGQRFVCDFAGAVTVVVDGAAWTRTWWSLQGDPVTEFSDVAKSRLGTWDGRFDADYAAWLATQSQPPACPGC